MFDLSIWEIAVIGVVAILVIGPKELPRAMITAGKWIRKFRTITSSFKTGLDAMIRETEMKELEEKWAEQNKKIMADHPNEMLPLEPSLPPSSEARSTPTSTASKSIESQSAQDVIADGDIELTKDANDKHEVDK